MFTKNLIVLNSKLLSIKLRDTGADPGFQVRGALKKIAQNGGGRENLCGISC